MNIDKCISSEPLDPADDHLYFLSRDETISHATTDSSTSARSFPVAHNNTLFQTYKIDTYVEKFATFTSKNADSILTLARIIVDAENDLTNDEFSLFLQKIKLHDKKSTLSRMRTIGQKLPRFETIRDRLPHSWTTIYKLAQLPNEEFDAIKHYIDPFLIAKDIAELLSKPAAEKKPSYQITINLDSIDEYKIRDVYENIFALHEQYDFSFKPNKHLNEYLSKTPSI